MTNRANPDAIRRLREAFAANRDRRILALGTTCAGKSTFAKEFPEALDQDELCWARLAPPLRDALAAGDWSPANAEAWAAHVRAVMAAHRIEPGRPVFGTELTDCDVIVYLKVGEATLRERAALRGIPYETAALHDARIREAVAGSGIEAIEVDA